MKRLILIVLVVIFLTIPVIYFVLQTKDRQQNAFIPWKMPKSPADKIRYSVMSEVPDYSITLNDVKFFDYVAENVGIFESDAVVDPAIYRGGDEYRHTVTHVRFMIVHSVPKLLVGVPGQNEIAAMGDYRIMGDTLELLVSINPNETASLAAGSQSLEDVFLRAALQTMYYAHGLSDDPKDVGTVFRNVQQGIKEYLYNNVVPWPIDITSI